MASMINSFNGIEGTQHIECLKCGFKESLRLPEKPWQHGWNKGCPHCMNPKFQVTIIFDNPDKKLWPDMTFGFEKEIQQWHQ